MQKKTATVDGIGFTVDQGYKGSGNVIQMNSTKGSGILYNTTAISGLKSITVNVSSGDKTYTITTGTSEKPTANSQTGTTTRTYNATSGDTYFQLKVSGASYFSSIVITYEDNTPSISADNVNLAYNATTGSIGYTINNSVAGGTLTATQPAWFTSISVGESSITFNCTENENRMERTANVTLTYNYTSGSVTKVISITQAGNPNASGTINNPYTVAQAIDATPTDGTSDKVYIRGKVSAFYGENILDDYNSYRYYISDDGSTTNQLLVYKGKKSSSENFSDVDDLIIGDEVVIYGSLTTYNNDPQITNGNYIVSLTRAKHTANFYVNGVYSSSIEVDERAAITFPTAPTDINGKTFVGWTTAELTTEQDEAPTMVTETTMGTSNISFYAVFVTKEGETGSYTLDYGQENNLSSSTSWGRQYGIPYTYTAIDGSQWVIKAYKSNGMQINTGKNCSIKIPNCPLPISTIDITGSTTKAVGFSSSDYTGSGTIAYLAEGTDASSQTLTLSGQNVSSGYIVPKSGSISITKIVVNYGSCTYSGYCTTIPGTASFTLSQNCYGDDNGTKYYGTYSNTSAFVVPSDLTVAEVSVTSGQLVVTPYDEGDIVPANTGVMVSSETYGLKTISLSSETATVDTEGNMLRPTGSGITAENMAQTGYKFYYLTMNGSQIGFYRRNDTGDAFDMPVANKAYLAVPEGQTGNVKGFSFNEVVDGIKAVEPTETKSNVIYNLSGQRVSKMQKGLYIVNGKKVLVK